jgi:predicted N-acetyltransferase YhbS
MLCSALLYLCAETPIYPLPGHKAPINWGPSSNRTESYAKRGRKPRNSINLSIIRGKKCVVSSIIDAEVNARFCPQKCCRRQSLVMNIEHLCDHRHVVDTLAGWHFAEFDSLAGAESLERYRLVLDSYATDESVPTTLVAIESGEVLGSASLLKNDLPIRQRLTPWLAQLYVSPAGRGRGVGAALVQRTLSEAASQGFDTLYLYTSGTLPQYYGQRGWKCRETLDYLGKERTVMERATRAAG